jgi:RNA polymerase primary sigma factor
VAALPVQCSAVAVNPSLGGEPAPPHSPDGPAVRTTDPGRQLLLAPDEELRLAWAVRAGDRRAAVLLIEANLRLVVTIARRYAGCGVPFLDLVQEGNVGLLHALDGFDPAHGGRFSTFAFWCIRHAVRQAAADQRRLVRIPPATAEALDRFRRAAARLAQVLGREPAAEELAQELGTTAERVTRLTRLSGPPPAPDGADRVGAAVASADDAVLAALRVDLYAVLARLTARERRVLRLRYGLVEGSRCSLEEVARRLGLPRERVREIEEGALARLRQAVGAPGLAGSLDEPFPSA